MAGVSCAQSVKVVSGVSTRPPERVDSPMPKSELSASREVVSSRY